ncbi:DEAD/DEAH box helicase family protein [Candidatus Daviesbacteria bacterium]|nr:DEAD/DEAH box helicase family protein [Candidatus Daviesbacteria bacterium]
MDIQLFMSIFKGRHDVYAKRWEKDGKNGYSPAYRVDWSKFAAFKARGGKFSDYPHKTPLPLTLEIIQSHLEGKEIVGIYPLLSDNTSYFIAADFDGENWPEEIRAFSKVCARYSIPTYLERSRSGNGGHVWIFFEDKYPAYKSRKIILEIIREALELSVFDREVSFDRLFPNQDYHTNKGFGNLIALPLQGDSLKNSNSGFLDPETLEILPDQWNFIKNIEPVSLDILDKLYLELVEELAKISNTQKATKGTLNVIIQNQIYLNKSQLTLVMVKFLRENLNFSNQEYFVKQKIGISTYKTEKYFRLIEETNDSVTIPRGFLNQLIEFCEENKIPFEIIDKREKLADVKFKSKISLRDYQNIAVTEAMNKDYGVIVAPSGSGKTVIGLELIARRLQPALILVHRKQLLDQWVERIESFLGIPKKDIGQISGNKKKPGDQITVAMVQSLLKMNNLDDISKSFGTILLDECHHVPARTFRELISNLNSYYLYGLTAAPQRKYNDEKLIYYYLGDEIVTIDPDQQKGSLTDKITVHIRSTVLSVPFDYKTDVFEVISKILIFDSARNLLICQDVLQEVLKGRKILILTERKEHVEVLNLYLKSHAEIITLTGEDSQRKRRLKIEQIKSGNFQILITTGQLFGEGMDFSAFNCLFLTYPFSFEGKLIQYIGRIQRSKSKQIIYDYRDQNVAFLERLFQKRLKYYQKRGWVEK